MSIFNNYKHMLTVWLLTVLINTSWTANINSYEDGKKPAVNILKQVDQRIADVIADGVLHFGHNLGLQLAAADPYATRSEIFSPLSLTAALSMLTLGAKGRTYQELKQLIGLDSGSEFIQSPNKYYEQFGLMLKDLLHANANNAGAVKRPNANWRYTSTNRTSNRRKSADIVVSEEENVMKIANGLFVQNDYTLNPDYSQVLQSIYETELTKLDFQARSSEARDFINAWVNKATFGKISHIIDDDFDASTNIVLVSALYFKAFWETTFLGGYTVDDVFYPDGEKNPSVKIQMMGNIGIFPFYDAKEYDCRIIGLPYKGNDTTMYVIQPNKSTRQKLRDLQHFLDVNKVNYMIDKMERKTTTLAFPKMHFTRRLSMKNILKAMNVRDIFANGLSDLSLIAKRSQTAPNAAQARPESVPVSFQSIYRTAPEYQHPITFTSRFGDSNNNLTSGTNTAAPQSSHQREKRQVPNYFSDPLSLALSNLETRRQKVDSYRADLYVDEILHNVEFTINEKGTEAAAVTSATAFRSGNEVNFRADRPFLIVIRHDPTKLPIFYGIINKPEL